MRILGIVLCLALSGCVNGGSGVTWWSPGTWFSGSSGQRVDSTAKKEEAAREGVIKAAQKSVHSTQIALTKAATSVPVAAATDFNTSATALLDQAAGPLTVTEVSNLRSMVEKLVSDDPKLRKEGERELSKQKDENSELSAKLAKAETASERASAALRKAFDRENELANELRNQRAFLWIAVGIAVLLAAAWVYVRIALGGIPGAVGRGLSVLRSRNPDAAAEITNILDGFLNRHEQDSIRKNSL